MLILGALPIGLRNMGASHEWTKLKNQPKQSYPKNPQFAARPNHVKATQSDLYHKKISDLILRKIPVFLISNMHVQNKKYGISSLYLGKCATEFKKKNICSSSPRTCLHQSYGHIFKSQK